VATETEGAKEILQNGETGLLVKVRDVPDLADAIGKLLANEDLRLRIRRRAGEEVRRRFTLNKMVNATEQVYQESINQKPALPQKVPVL
jgi:glycosyltransferase involved in cell wall biosynthesis